MPKTSKHSEGEMKPTSATCDESQELSGKKPRGFAAMDPERHRLIAQAGGLTAHALGKAHQYTSEEARAAGRIGGKRSGELRAARAAARKQGSEAASAGAVRP